MMCRHKIISTGWLLAAMLFWATLSVAQSVRFSKHYDLNSGAGLIESIVLLENGNLLGVGSNVNLNNGGNTDGHHVLISANGTVLQEHSFTFTGKTYNTQQVMKDENTGSLYASGYFCNFDMESLGYCDFYFNKLNEVGDTLFTKIYQRKDTCDVLLDMVQTRPNKIMLIGYTCNDTTEDNTELMFITVDTAGNELNRVVWGGQVRIL